MTTAPGGPHTATTRDVPARPSRRDSRPWVTAFVMALGAAMLVWSGVIHLHLWASGYRTIPTIGWLFMLQALGAFVLGALVLITRHLLPAAAAALFMASTACGLIWSVEWGLFGFRDSFNSPFATESLGIEAAGAGVLLVGCALVVRRHRTWARPGDHRRADANREPRH
jgi:hypothetical protein